MLTYLGPMWEEVLKTDTTRPAYRGRKRLVGNIVDGSAQGLEHRHRGCGQPRQRRQSDRAPLSPGNLFAFGRQAWDWTLGLEDIARRLGADDLGQ
jgi:alpha-glucuronidase